MTWQKKVVWSEGMFLRPQQFQQQERYLEYFAHSRALASESHFWGFLDIEIDENALSIGKVDLKSARGVLPDGTPFSFPAQCPGPLPLDFPLGLREQRVYLALPMRRFGTEEVVFDDSAESLARYRVTETELRDINSIGGEPALTQLAEPRLRLVTEADLTEGWVAIGVLRVIERRTDHQLILDKQYIPPVLAIGGLPGLRDFLTELHGLLHQRGETLAARLSQPGRGGIAEVGDFLMLELINRYEPLLAHFGGLYGLHPERLFAELLSLAGDLTTFSRAERRPQVYPAYNHDDLASCYHPLMADLRHSLSMVLEQNAIQIELQERNYGVRVAVIRDVELIRTANFVLAVHADLPADVLRTRFPTQAKIGPVERIRDLVNLHLPGVTLRALPVAPRQIPYNAGYNYFELDTSHELWKQLDRSGGLAMHLAGDFPDLALEFWAIRR
jgi:type VI secretion system protein ImpJ